MSRRLRYTSSHSHESSPPGDCNSRPSAEQTKTATATVHPSLIVPSSFQATHSHRRQAPYPPTDLAAEYLQCGYEPAQYSRAPSEKPIDPRYTSTASAFEHVDPDSLHYSIAPSSLSFHVPNLSDPEMSNYSYPGDPLASSYRGGNTYDQCRSPSMRDFAYSGAEPSQRRTSSPSSYGAGSNFGSTPYGRAGSVSSTQGSYLGGMTSPPPAYNGIPYQPSYGLDSVNPQSVCNPSHAPALPGMLDSTQLGYRSRQMSSASVTSVSPERIKILETRAKPQCWEHGCNGRQFSTFSNLLRHQREKSGTAAKSYCPRCNAEFTRTTARNGHMQHEKCKPRSSEER